MSATGGVRTSAAETLLISRAIELLSRGPADAMTLIAEVCQLPGPPSRVAEEMALALFAGRRDFTRDGEGMWRLAANADPSTISALSFVVVDVETTGMRALHGDRVTEVAATIVRNGVVTDTFQTLVNPERPIPPMITALTRITWNMVRNKPTFREICDELLGFMEGHIFVAHNAGFDWRFIAAEVERATAGRLRLEGRQLCTVRLARALLPQLRRRSLDHVAAHYGVEIMSRHRAGGDALATAHCLLGLLRDAEDRGCTCWDDVELLAGQRRKRPRRGRARRSALPQPVREDTTA
ncbi:MAG: 3'-5' exonuclease [Gemmatimonadaceae bacterium]